jgi:hypothetical protein
MTGLNKKLRSDGEMSDNQALADIKDAHPSTAQPDLMHAGSINRISDIRSVQIRAELVRVMAVRWWCNP